jgi:uncharacterized membrane protein (DUF4010 family)
MLASLGISLVLGLLVGLQRERTDAGFAGFRTFPLVTVLGAICGLLGRNFGGWVVAAGLISLAGLMIVANVKEQTKGSADPGMTTEMAMLLMFGIGAFLSSEQFGIGIALGAIVALLLHLKPQMHAWADNISDRDFRAIMRFVLVSMVILPILPNERYGPLHVLNPFTIWLFVVFIVGINLTGYLLYKFLGQKAGTLLAGVLGGFISSTATTFMYARRTRESPDTAGIAAVVINLASTIQLIRLLIIVGVVAPGALPGIIAPFGVMFVVMSALSLAFWWFVRKEHGRMPAQSNPTELKSALVFALIFAAVLFGVAAAKEYLGRNGLYAASALSGLVDVDAIALSLSQALKSAELEPANAWRLLLIAAMSNLVFKAGIVLIQGSRQLLGRIAVLFGVALAVGALLLKIWPDQ